MYVVLTKVMNTDLHQYQAQPTHMINIQGYCLGGVLTSILHMNSSSVVCVITMWPDFIAQNVVLSYSRLASGILSILSYVDNHEEQSLSLHLVHIWSLYKL